MQLELLQGRSFSLASAKKGAWPTPAQKKCGCERRFPRAYQQLDGTLPRERVQEALEGG
jgi:hypothetical protein